MPEIPSQVNIASWFIDRPSREFPERVAVLCEDREVRYRELAQLTSRAGNAFRNLGCGPGDRVLIALQDSPEFIAAFFGAAKIGAIAVPVNPGSRTAEYLLYFEDADPRIVIADDTALPQLEPALAERPITAI